MASTIHTIQLPDKRTIACYEYGDSTGQPVVFHHGFMCTHLQVAKYDTIATKAGIRLLIPHRPGYPGSCPSSTSSPQSFAKDIEHVLTELHITAHSIIATSGGTAFAFAHAERLHAQCTGLTIISGLYPFKHAALQNSQSLKTRIKYAIIGAMPFIARNIIGKKVRAIVHDANGYYESLLQKVPKADKKALLDPDVRKGLVESFATCAPNGTEHLAREYMAYWQWQCVPEEFPAEFALRIIHGKQDRLSPYNYVQAFTKSFKNVTLEPINGGHFAPLLHIEEILKTAIR